MTAIAATKKALFLNPLKRKGKISEKEETRLSGEFCSRVGVGWSGAGGFGGEKGKREGVPRSDFKLG